MAAAEEDRPLERPRCACGTDRTHRFATPEREYSISGTLYLLWGGTAVPRKVRFRCVRCGQVFDETTDPSERKRLMI
jgi:hypothetical protein